MRMSVALLGVAVLVALPADAAPGDPILGKPLGTLTGVRWVTPDGKADAFANHKLTIIRWWTTDCPHCSASIPSLASLWKKHRAQGLNLVAMFHHKGGRRKSDRYLETYLRRLGFDGTLARDDRWTKLREVMRRDVVSCETSFLPLSRSPTVPLSHCPPVRLLMFILQYSAISIHYSILPHSPSPVLPFFYKAGTTWPAT